MNKYMVWVLLCVFYFGSSYAKNTDEYEIDIEAKRKNMELLVNKAVELLANKEISIEYACHLFATDVSWRRGDVALSLISASGDVILSTEDPVVTWHNVSRIEQMFTRAREGGGWIQYPLHNQIKTAYVQQIKKDGHTYIVHAGVFVKSPEYQALALVNIVADFIKKQGAQVAFKLINNRKIAAGNLTPLVIELDGTLRADPFARQMIGKNLLDPKIAGAPLADIVKRIVETASSIHKKGWVDHDWRKMHKRTFAQQFVDPATQKTYIIAAGYYPNVSKNMVTELVRRAKSYLITFGQEEAFKEFANINGAFLKGDLNVAVYDDKGKLVIDSIHPEDRGKDFADAKDQQGKPYFNLMMEKIKETGTAWMSYIIDNAARETYFEKAEGPWGTYILASSIEIDAKPDAAHALCSGSADFLETHEAPVAFDEFSKEDGPFIQGDLFPIVYDLQGNCLVFGANHHRIWENNLNVTDQTGIAIVRSLIDLVQSEDEGSMAFNINNGVRRVFVNRVDKELPLKDKEGQPITQSFIVCVGYYT